MREIWLSIDGFEDYSISNYGRVRRDAGGQGALAGRILSPHAASNKYFNVRLNKSGKVFSPSIHTLVALHFIGERPAGNHVRHLDGNKQNNIVTNLAYGTPTENAQDKARHGRTQRGETSHLSRITQRQAEACIELLKADVRGIQIADMLQISKHIVYKIKSGQSWAWISTASNRRIDGSAT